MEFSVDTNTASIEPGQRRWLIIIAWTSILLISDLPDVIFKAVTGQVPVWLFWAKIAVIVCFAGLCFVWKTIRPLLPYAIIMSVFLAALGLSEWIRTSAWWANFLSDAPSSFALDYLRPYLRDIGVTAIVLAALFLVKRRRSEFFLVKGQMDAPIAPIKWLGIREGKSWRTYGWIFAIAAAVGVAFPTFLALQPNTEILAKIIPLLPAILIYAAVNAFNEELYFRATLLSTLPQAIGKNHAMLINMVFFGLAHYLYGSPPGLVGFLMTGFLAYLLGKSMLETKGFLWAWFIHFLPDVVIFASYAIAWLRS
jgi:membrane protease YdiL (CAAX protease family)